MLLLVSCALALYLHVAAEAKGCPNDCSSRGTCNPYSGRCHCAFGYLGSDCSLWHMEPCQYGEHMMHLFDRLEGKLLKQHPYDLEKDPRAGFRLQQDQDSPYFGLVERPGGLVYYGPRRCDCLSRVFSLLRTPAKQLRVLCVHHPHLRAFLDEPDLAQWRVLQWPSNTLTKLPNCTTPRLDGQLPSESHGGSWITAAPRVAQTVVPARQCGGCGGLGWCGLGRGSQPGVAAFSGRDAAGETAPRCHCFRDIATGRGGTCVPSQQDFVCPFGCSGHGVCQSGFCACHPGYFGFDCGLSVQSHPTGGRSQRGALVYVYDLPVHYCTGFQLLNLFSAAEFRTADPAQADFFFIPSSHKISQTFFLGLVDYLATQLPHWNASVRACVANQLVGHLQDHGYSTAWWALPLTTASVPAFPHHSHPQDPRRPLAALLTHLLVDGIDAGQQQCRVCMQRGKDIVMPPLPRMVDGPCKSYSPADLRRLSPWAVSGGARTRRLQERNCLVYFAGATHFKFTESHDPSLRLRIIRQFGTSNYSAWVKIFDSTRVKLPMQDGMSQCKFCLVPFGTWGGYGGRYVSSVLFGCIPVFLYPDFAPTSALHPPLSRPFDELPDVPWDRCSLQLPYSKAASLPSVLELVSEQQVTRMQDCLSGIWQRMMYGSVTKISVMGERIDEDAFHSVHSVLTSRRDSWAVKPAQNFTDQHGDAQPALWTHAQHAHLPAERSTSDNCKQSDIAVSHQRPAVDMTWR